jgi:hypothetical protein
MKPKNLPRLWCALQGLLPLTSPTDSRPTNGEARFRQVEKPTDVLKSAMSPRADSRAAKRISR